MAKRPIARLLRIAWDPVGRIVARVVAGHLDESRLAGLVTIGCETRSEQADGHDHTLRAEADIDDGCPRHDRAARRQHR